MEKEHIERYYNPERINTLLEPGRVLVIYGPRRSGKTTLVQDFLASTTLRYRLDSGDNIRIQRILASSDFSQILPYAEGLDLLAIDEAQRIPNIGTGLKILVDQLPHLRIIATGSSSFDLANAIGEPLTGRKHTITLYPFAQRELLHRYSRHELVERIPEWLIYGTYPEVAMANTREHKVRLLEELVDEYLLKDALAFERLRAPYLLHDLLKLLAFQIGREVSIHELTQELRKNHPGTTPHTTARYLELLEKSFIITRLGGFSRNLRKEIGTKKKYYFFDTGVRNALIGQLQPLDMRNDIGYLWENFVAIERLKKRAFDGIYGDTYFWRTYDGEEIDLVEDRDGVLHGYEVKWGTNKDVRAPRTWKSTYPEATFDVITPNNYLEFVG
jgi:predicted AAA+ superfamily ATPase